MLAFVGHTPDHPFMAGLFREKLTDFSDVSGPLKMPGTIRAALGPTNTGKTHYALTRMMAHRSGIIGFPLRLLARENYERLVQAKGHRSVALITGEEKIVPHGAHWFSCTVEAMPLDRKVEFVAIDEIQLAADPDRGHVFTDRLLHARGTVETLFLGAETIRPLLRRLIPDIAIETRARLSHLVHSGATKLSRLPPRSAIVAFSMAEVYALAEVVRQRRGGCAVIMGQLSPRTRNAQVELYQNRDVDYLVATDAIGMGLNMDVDHVALAQLSKFDGQASRSLFPQEIAQIAGRAGRGMRDGTFGTTAECTPLSETMASAIEHHRFEPIQRVSWRNSALDFTNPRSLLNSLTAIPPHRSLVTGRVASDVTTLETLILEPDIQAVARGHAATSLLWDVCQIPDFRKIGDDSHARLCAKLYLDILHKGGIPPNWIEGHLRSLDKPEGDIDTLMQRLTGVRVCAYVAARKEWSRHSVTWQTRAREVEDRLSDALHDRLTSRFVDRRAATLLRRLDDSQERSLLSAVTADGTVIVEGHEIGKVEGFTLQPGQTIEQAERAMILRAGRRALQQEIPRRIQRLLDAPDSALELDVTTGMVLWDTTPLGRLVAGRTLLSPGIRLLPADFADTAQRIQVETRLLTFVHLRLQQVFAALVPLEKAASSDPALRGIVHRLVEDGGIAPLLPSDHALPFTARRTLTSLGVAVGRFALFMSCCLRPHILQYRLLLEHIRAKRPGAPPSLSLERVSLPRASVQDLPGWVPAGAFGIRLDIAERRVRELASLTAKTPKAAPVAIASWLGIRPEHLPDTLKELGVRCRPPGRLDPKVFGPASPLMLFPQRVASTQTKSKRRAANRSPILPRPDSPFAVLADLHFPKERRTTSR